MKDVLKTIIKDWQKAFPKSEVWERKLKVPLDSKKSRFSPAGNGCWRDRE